MNWKTCLIGLPEASTWREKYKCSTGSVVMWLSSSLCSPYAVLKQSIKHTDFIEFLVITCRLNQVMSRVKYCRDFY